MNRPNVHPDTELLDRLRAGLLDNDPQRLELEAHLSECADCRRRADWQSLMQPAGLEPASAQRLDSAREQALRAPQHSLAARRLVPLAAAASIALLAVVLVSLLPQPGERDPQLAATGGETPEFYEELDFYLWLADHKGVNKDSAT